MLLQGQWLVSTDDRLLNCTHLRIVRDWRPEEGVLFLTIKDLVHKVPSFERFELLFVRWPPVLALSYCLISSAILDVSLVHRGRDRGGFAVDCQGAVRVPRPHVAAR